MLSKLNTTSQNDKNNNGLVSVERRYRIAHRKIKDGGARRTCVIILRYRGILFLPENPISQVADTQTPSLRE